MSGVLFATFALAAGAGAEDEALRARLETLSKPQGFSIGVYAAVPGARSLARDPDSGAIFVGTWGGDVYAVWDNDGDARADSVQTVLSDLKVPNGVAVHGGYLYVAEQHRIARYPIGDLAPGRRLTEAGEMIFDRLPDKLHHGWRYVGFGPDGRLYVTVGVACNICDFEEPEGTILRMDPDGGHVEVFARGIRNSVGFDFQPGTGVLHFTDNNTDDMGDDIPACELNAAPEPGMHFGFPYYAGGHTRHPDWAGREPPREVAFPVVEFDAHTAPLGVRFYTGSMFPDEYRQDAFVAQHGSWNRSVPIGYRIMRVRFDDAGQVSGHEVFIEGWLEDRLAWGRPVDLLELPDGSLVISDDNLGVLYRVHYAGRGTVSTERGRTADDLASTGRFKSGTCTTCHGGQGITLFPVMPNLAGQRAWYLASQLRAYRDGRRSHPLMTDAVRHMSDADIEAIAAYYETRTPMRGRPDAALASRGEALYRGGGLPDPTFACAACHGADASGNESYPALRGQHAGYTIATLLAYANGERNTDASGIMPKIARSLSEEEMRAIAAYLEGMYPGTQ
jgi:glucose/arabinose dehydrogenase/cytochrome c553